MRDVISQALLRQLGDDWFELWGEVAVDSIVAIRNARLLDVRWGRVPQYCEGNVVVPLFELDGFEQNPIVYGGRCSTDDLPRCPLVSVFAARIPVVLRVRELKILQRVTGPRRDSLKSVIDGLLWASCLGLRRCSRAALS